jgi:hypothetical protein
MGILFLYVLSVFIIIFTLTSVLLLVSKNRWAALHDYHFHPLPVVIFWSSVGPEEEEEVSLNHKPASPLT